MVKFQLPLLQLLPLLTGHLHSSMVKFQSYVEDLPARREPIYIPVWLNFNSTLNFYYSYNDLCCQICRSRPFFEDARDLFLLT